MLFNYEAVDKEGAVIRGEINFRDKATLIEYLAKKDLTPVSVHSQEEASSFVSSVLSVTVFERITALDRILLARNLAAAVKSGIGLLEIINILLADATKSAMKKILTRAKGNIENGKPLWVTFTEFPNFFPPIFAGMVKAGEASGKLDHTLAELSRHLTREYGLTRKIRSALAYPAILLVASFGIVVFLMTFVLPRLSKIFQQSGAELPAITRMVVAASNFITNNLFLLFIAIALSIVFIAYSRKTKFGGKILFKILFRIPLVGELIKKVALVRFARTLGGLISSGMPIIESLELTAGSVANPYYQEIIFQSIERIKSGVPISKTLAENPDFFPRFLTSLVAVGERTGQLDEILKNFADFYDEEIDQVVKDLTSFLEPVLLLLMGLIVGVIALSILLPIYGLVGKFA